MKFSFLIVQIRLGNAGIVQKWNCGPRGWNSILKMSLVALKHFPQPNLKPEGMWWRIKMLSFAKRESLWLMNLDGVKLYGCPPGGGNFPFNVKVNLKPALSIWLSASQGAQCRLFPRCPAPVGHLPSCGPLSVSFGMWALCKEKKKRC